MAASPTAVPHHCDQCGGRFVAEHRWLGGYGLVEVRVQCAKCRRWKVLRLEADVDTLGGIGPIAPPRS